MKCINFYITYNIPSLNQEKIENLNKPITSNKIELVMKETPTNKNPGPNSVLNSTKNLKKCYLYSSYIPKN